MISNTDDLRCVKSFDKDFWIDGYGLRLREGGEIGEVFGGRAGVKGGVKG